MFTPVDNLQQVVRFLRVYANERQRQTLTFLGSIWRISISSTNHREIG